MPKKPTPNADHSQLELQLVFVEKPPGLKRHPGASKQRKPLSERGSGPKIRAVSSSDALTKRQQSIVNYLQQREKDGFQPPSLNEICKDLGLVSRGSLHKQIIALTDARLVEPMEGKRRGVRLTPTHRMKSNQVQLLGKIAAGHPIEAIAQHEWVEIPKWLRTDAQCYALKIKGDSMQDAGILDGDYVVVEQKPNARNGELVVALIDEKDATLKRFERHAEKVLLHPANASHEVQVFAADRVAIQGVVVAQFRKY